MRRTLRIVSVVLLIVLSGLYLPQHAGAQGQVYTDTMDSAATGLLSTTSSTPGITYSYQNGQFLIQASEPSFQGELLSFFDLPEMSDVRVTVDVALGEIRQTSTCLPDAVRMRPPTAILWPSRR